MSIIILSEIVYFKFKKNVFEDVCVLGLKLNKKVFNSLGRR